MSIFPSPALFPRVEVRRTSGENPQSGFLRRISWSFHRPEVQSEIIIREFFLSFLCENPLSRLGTCLLISLCLLIAIPHVVSSLFRPEFRDFNPIAPVEFDQHMKKSLNRGFRKIYRRISIGPECPFSRLLPCFYTRKPAFPTRESMELSSTHFAFNCHIPVSGKRCFRSGFVDCD